MDYNKIPLEFGSYVQLLDCSVNMIRLRTIGAIALNPTGNENGAYRFMSLKTGQVITKGPGSWTEGLVTDIAIARVEALVKQEGQPLLQDSNLLVEWRPNQPFDDDDEYDDDYEPSVVGSEDDVDLEVDDPIDEELVDVADDIGNHETTNQGFSQGGQLNIKPVTGDLTQTQLEGAGVGVTHDDKMDIGEDDAVHVEEEGANTKEDDRVAHMEEEGAGQVEEEGVSDNTGEEESDTRNNEETAQWSRYNLRSSRSREYSHRFDPQVYNVTNLHISHTPRKPVNITQKVFGFMFTQMTACAGIKKHGQAARDALTAEFAQLDYKGAYEPVHTMDLTKSQ